MSYLIPNGKLELSANGSLGLGTSTPDLAAQLEMKSTTQGFLPPRMTTTQRNAIVGSSLATGRIIAYYGWNYVPNGSQIIIDGITLTYGTDWVFGGNDHATDLNLTDAINNSVPLQSVVTANVNPGGYQGISVTAVVPGLAGNSVTMVTNPNPVHDQYNRTSFYPSGPTLTGGGALPAGLQIYNTTTNQDEFYNGSVWGAVSPTPVPTSPAGSNTQIQYNNSGAFGASSNLTFDSTSGNLSLGDDQKIVLGNSTQAWIDYNSLCGSINFQTQTSGGVALVGSEGSLVLNANYASDGSGTQLPVLELGIGTGHPNHMLLGVGTAGSVQIQQGFSSIDYQASALLNLKSTTQGFLIPRMTTTQRNAIISPATGLQIYNTTTNQDEFYNGSVWGAIGNSTPGGSNTQIQYNNSGAFAGLISVTTDGTNLDIKDNAGVAGNLTLTTTTATTGGNLTLTTGSVAGHLVGGNLILTCGVPVSSGNFGNSTGGSILLTTPGSGSANGMTGGNFTMTTGSTNNGSNGGTMTLTTGDGGSVQSPSFILTTGNTTGTNGAIQQASGMLLTTGNNNNTTGGGPFYTHGPNLTISTGNSNGTGPINGGGMTISTGSVTGTGSAIGGGITLTSGSSSGGTDSGGSITLTSNTPANGGNLFLTGSASGYGQVGVGTTSPDSSASVDITSTTRGFLPPRMTTIQRTAISSPAEGLLVYDVTLHKLYGWDGTIWQAAW